MSHIDAWEYERRPRRPVRRGGTHKPSDQAIKAQLALMAPAQTPLQSLQKPKAPRG